MGTGSGRDAGERRREEVLDIVGKIEKARSRRAAPYFLLYIFSIAFWVGVTGRVLRFILGFVSIGYADFLRFYLLTSFGACGVPEVRERGIPFHPSSPGFSQECSRVVEESEDTSGGGQQDEEDGGGERPPS